MNYFCITPVNLLWVTVYIYHFLKLYIYTYIPSRLKKSCEMHEKSFPQTNYSPNICTRLLTCSHVHKQKACKFKTFIAIELRAYNQQFISVT